MGKPAMNCSIFRNEGSRVSSELVLEAERMAQAKWGDMRMYTYIAPDKIQSRNPGYCFKVAGWRKIGVSKKGLHLLVKECDANAP